MPRTGRPPLEDPRSAVTSVRLTAAEHAAARTAAARAGVPLGAWMRDAVVAATRRA